MSGKNKDQVINDLEHAIGNITKSINDWEDGYRMGSITVLDIVLLELRKTKELMIDQVQLGDQ